MRRRPTWMALVVSAGLTMAPTGNDIDATEQTCCFTHPSYTGTCEVTPSEGETC